MKKTLSLLLVFVGAFAILGQGLTIRSAFYLPSIKPSVVGGGSTWTNFGLGFDNSTTRLERANGFDGISNSFQGTFSTWFKVRGSGDARAIIQTSSTDFSIKMSAGDALQIDAWDATDSKHVMLSTISENTIPADGLWHHFFVAWDTAVSNLVSYLDGTNQVIAPQWFSTSPTDRIRYTNTTWWIGALSGSGQNWNGDLSETWFSNNQITNVLLFRSAGPSGCAVDLGADGSAPLGFAPAFYLHTNAANCTINASGRGDFTMFGTITNTVAPCGP